MAKTVLCFDSSEEVAQEPGRIVEIATELPVLDFAPDLTLRPLVGRNLLASFVRYEAGAVAPLHSHVEKQVFIAVEGEFEIHLGDVTQRMLPGMAAMIPAHVPHSVRCLNAPGYQIDVFSPSRQATLDALTQQG